MKKTLRKVLKFTGITFGILLLVIILIPILFGSQIKEAVKNYINQEVNAVVYFDDVGVSIFKNFPNITVSLDKFGVIGKDEFEGDTLADIEHLGVVVNLFSLFSEKYEVNGVTLATPDIHAKVLANGKPNWDIMKSAVDSTTIADNDEIPDSTTASLALALNSYSISDGHVIYDDKVTDFYLEVSEFNHDGKGNFADADFEFDTESSAGVITMRSLGTEYITRAKMDADITMNIDTKNSIFTLKENRIKLNELEMHVDGFFKIAGDDVIMDVTFESDDESFDGIFSVMPGIYQKDFADIDTDGTFDLEGWVKGTSNVVTGEIPAFNAHLAVNNGRFRYPDLPEEVKDINFDLKVDCPKGDLNLLKIDFPKFHAQMGGAPIDARLMATNLMSDNIKIDAQVKAKVDLANVSKFYPMEGQDMRGKFSVDGTAKGTVNYVKGVFPVVNASMQLENGYYKNSEFPSALENMTLDASMRNANGDLGQTTLNVRKFHTEIDGSPIDATLNVVNFNDPKYDLTAKGALDLAKLNKIYPIEGTTMTGMVNLDLQTSGQVSDIENQRYSKLPTSGSLSMQKVVYTSTDYPMGFGVSDGQMTFNPQKMEIKKFTGRAGSSPISVTGYLQNYLAYFMMEKEELKGKMSLTSSRFNVNEWLVEEGNQAAASTTASEAGAPSDEEVPMEVIQIPEGIDFTFDCRINTVLYDNLTFKNLTGQVILKDREVRFKELKFSTLGGNFRMTGGYGTQNPAAPDVDINMTLVDVDIPQAYKAFPIVQALAPVAKFMEGKINSSLNLKGKLLSDMTPDLSTITSVGDLVVNNGVLNGFKPIQKVADKIKLPRLSQLKIDRTKVLYEIANGRIKVDPFDIPVSSGNMRVAGSNGIDQSIDYNLELDIPTGAAGKAAVNAVSGLINKSVGDGDVNLKALIGLGGTVTDPVIKYVRSPGGTALTDIKEDVKEKVDSVKTVVKDTVKAVVDNAKDKAKEELRKKADALIKSAEAQAAKIRSEAKNAAAKVRSEANERADQTEASARNILEKKAKEKAADLIRKKGNDAANKLEREADEKANKVTSEARQRADAMLK